MPVFYRLVDYIREMFTESEPPPYMSLLSTIRDDLIRYLKNVTFGIFVTEECDSLKWSVDEKPCGTCSFCLLLCGMECTPNVLCRPLETVSLYCCSHVQRLVFEFWESSPMATPSKPCGTCVRIFWTLLLLFISVHILNYSLSFPPLMSFSQRKDSVLLEMLAVEPSRVIDVIGQIFVFFFSWNGHD